MGLFWQGWWSARSVAVMLDSDELARIMVEISAGWEWGDPRSEVLQTPEHEAKWKIIARQMKEIADEGGIVDIPSGFPDLTGHREKWPQPHRDTDDSKKRAVTSPSRPLVPEKPKKASKPEPSWTLQRPQLHPMPKCGETQLEWRLAPAFAEGSFSG